MVRTRLGLLGSLVLLASACGVAYSPIGSSGGGLAGGNGNSAGVSSAGTAGSTGTHGSSTSGTSGTTTSGTSTGAIGGTTGTTGAVSTSSTSNSTSTSAGGTGSGTTSGTSGGGTTGPDCSPNRQPIETAVCGTDQDCGCPLGCDQVASACKFVCQITADCQNSGEFCFANSNGAAYCDVNFCSNIWGACNAEASGDGTCTPVPYSTQGVCFQAGSAGLGSACDFSFTRDAGPLCMPGDFCYAPSGTSGTCVTGCDPTADAGPCQAGQSCAAIVGTPSHPSSAQLGYCLTTALGDGGLALPQVPNNGGFGTVTVPNLVTVSFQGYPYGVQSYGDWMVGSQWLATVGADYGISNGGSHLADLVIQGSAPASVTDSDIRDTLATLILDGGIPSPTDSTIYLIYYPDTTSITAIGSVSCQFGGFGGYHEMFTLDGGAVIYGVIATCSNSSGIGPSEADGVALAASHEFMEAATDPDSASQNGGDRTWAFSDFTHPWAWSFGEVADPCTGAPTSETTDAGTFIAQRVWSNTAAATGNESPCVPIPSGEVYFTVYTNPVLTQLVNSSATIDQSVVYTLIPWSNGPVAGGWNVFAGSTIFDSVNGTLGGTVTFNQADGGAGNTNSLSGVYVGAPITMTVDIPAGTGSQSLIQVQIYSYTDITFNNYNIWPAAIVTQ